jgi:hypothetical protein
MKTIVVLGMHRSATSMTARALHKSNEVFMGEKLLLGLSDNPKGHYEDTKFLNLNIEILRSAGGSWNNPPTREKILEQRGKFDGRIKSLVEESVNNAKRNGSISWGFKDPRTVLTIDLYLPHLPNPQFITCYRDPMEIAKSLNKRDRIPIKKGIKLSKIYNERLTEFISEWMEKKFKTNE